MSRRARATQNGASAVTQRPRASCGIRIIDELVPILEEVAAPVLNRHESLAILKNLMVYSSETPFAHTENLFRSDQVTEVNVYLIHDGTQLAQRNWQWVLSLCSMNPPDSLEDLAWRKSKAVEMGRLMSLSESPNNDRVRSIIGFWLHRLYLARNPGLMFPEVPESVRNAYHKFLLWQGFHWRVKDLPLKLMDQLISYLRFPQSLTQTENKAVSKKQIMIAGFWKKDGKDDLPDHAEQCRSYCNASGVGIKRLVYYLSNSFNGTLAEFATTEFDWKEDIVQQPKHFGGFFAEGCSTIPKLSGKSS